MQVHQVLVSTFLRHLLRHLPILRRLLDDFLVMHILYSQENIKICLPRGHKNEIQRWTKSHFSKFEVGMMHISQIRGTYVCCCFLKKIAVASSEINLNNYLVLQHEQPTHYPENFYGEAFHLHSLFYFNLKIYL